MTTLGFCTHFTQADEWAFQYAFRLAQARGWQLNICHWLRSPYLLRRDLIGDDLFQAGEPRPVSLKLLAKLEQQLREYYEPKLKDFTQVAFKLCEGQYQVELVRCFRKNLLDLVVIGYQQEQDTAQDAAAHSQETFAARLAYPVILVGRDGPQSYLLNAPAQAWLDRLDLPQGAWELLQPLESAALAG